MKCHKCGLDYNEKARFCENCGNKLEIDKFICGKCGNECDLNSLFCANCGNSLKRATPATSESNQIESINQDNIQINKSPKNKKKKIVTIIGSILCSILILISVFYELVFVFEIGELYYPTTIIMPLITSASFIISGIVGIIACVKYKKKILVSAVCLFLIALVLYPTSKFVNQSITRSDGAPKNEAEEVIEEYKDECIIVPYDDLKDNPDEYQDKHVKYIGQVVQVINNSNSYSEYLIDISKTYYGYEDTVYVTFPHYSDKNIDLSEDNIVIFYGYSDGLYSYENAYGNDCTVPKITARYLEFEKSYETQLKYLDDECILVTYDDLKLLANTPLTKDSPFIRIKGKITNENYLDDHIVFMVDVSETEEKIMGVVYDGNEYIKVDNTVEYTFYGVAMTNITTGENSESIPTMTAYKIGWIKKRSTLLQQDRAYE